MTVWVVGFLWLLLLHLVWLGLLVYHLDKCFADSDVEWEAEHRFKYKAETLA